MEIDESLNGALPCFLPLSSFQKANSTLFLKLKIYDF